MIKSDGNTTPSVAMIPPKRPPNFSPINVATLTMITPGVH